MDIEKIRKQKREYYYRNLEKQKKYAKIYRKKNKEKRREYDKKWIEKNKEKHLKYHRKYKKLYFQKNKARLEARKIKFPKGLKCYICSKRLAKEKHHPDYFKPLEIIPLCKKCHLKIHNNNNSLFLTSIGIKLGIFKDIK